MKNKKHKTLQYSWLVFERNTKKKRVLLGFVEGSLCATGEVLAQRSSHKGTGSHALESSSVTLGFGEFEASLKNSSSFSMLWSDTQYGKQYNKLFRTIWLLSTVRCLMLNSHREVLNTLRERSDLSHSSFRVLHLWSSKSINWNPPIEDENLGCKDSTTERRSSGKKPTS